MPLRKCHPKGVGFPRELVVGQTSSTAHANGVCINLSSANLNGGRILFDKNLKIPPAECEKYLVNRTPILSERNHSNRRRAISLNRECDLKRNLMRPPSSDPLPKFSAECYRNVTSSKSEGATSVHNFQHNGLPNTGTKSHYPQENVHHKGCTINLQPGHYKVNIEWRSASKPFLITFVPSKDKGEGNGTPPREPEPLLYGESSQPPSPVSSISLPRRIVHKLIRSPNSSGINNMHIVHRAPGMKKLPDNSRQNHRKGKHRWASLSCVHAGNLDDSLSEQSGCDSFAGYEGVEHLKRGSVSTAPYENDNNSQTSKIIDCNTKNMTSQIIDSRSCNDSLGRSAKLNTDFNKEYLPCRSNLPLYTVSCEALINSHMDNYAVYEHIKDRRTWHEDESFLKQVVDEYFNDCTVNDCSSSVPSISKELVNKDVNSLIIKKGIVKSTSDCYLSQRSKPITANIIPLQASSKISSSCIITKTTSLLETVKEISMDGKKDTEDNNFDENSVGEADETTSYHSDNSSGYEADTEPSDKDIYGMFFWREWMSAPDVSSKGHQPTVEESTIEDYSTSENRKFSQHQTAVHKPPFLRYGPRKSSSSGDTQKLSQTFVGVEKYRAHKLRRFLDDLCNESKVSSIRKIKRIEENEDCSFSKDCDETASIPDDRDFSGVETACNYSVNPLQPSVESSPINMEFVNKKFLDKNNCVYSPVGYGVQRISDTSLDDRLSADLTDKALSDGLVITQSKYLQVEQLNHLSPPHLLGNNSPPKFKYNSGTCFTNKSIHAFENKSSFNEKIGIAAAKLCNDDHSCLRESWDSLSKINRHKNGCRKKCTDDNYHVYYNVRSFCSNNRNMKNISKKRRLKHLNGDIWQSEEILSCCMSPGKPSSLQHFQDSSENMACSPSIEQSSQSYRSDLDLTRPFVSCVGRVLERGTKQDKSAIAKEITQHSELHVPPVSLFESVIKEQSMPLSGNPASPLQRVPNPQRQHKVSKYIMGNIQPGKENNSSLTEDSDNYVEVDKSSKKKSSSKVKSRKSFNTFLGSFGAAGALAKNISNTTDKKKANIFVSSTVVSENCKDSPYNLTANKIKCDTYVDKTQCSSSAISPSHGHLTREHWTPANDRTNYSPVRRKVRKEFKNNCENSDGVTTNVLKSVSKVYQSNICGSENENEKNVDQPIYENIPFHKQRYDGKFSYINSLIPNSDCEENTVSNPTESDILSHPIVINSSTQASPSITSHDDSFIVCASDNSVQNRIPHVATSDQTNFSAPLDQSDQVNKLDSMDLNEIYEDFLSAKDSPRSSVAMPFKFEDYDVSDGTEEGVSDEENSVAKCSSLCRSASAGSVVSDASSFYYTAGGAALNEVVEAVTEYFSVGEKIDENESELANSDFLPKKRLEVEESELVFKKSECEQKVKETVSSENLSDKSDSSVRSEFHDYENANVVVTDDKIFITLKTSAEENSKYFNDPNGKPSSASRKETEKLTKIGNETNHEIKSKLGDEIQSEKLFNSNLQCKINPNYRSYGKLRNRSNIKNRPPATSSFIDANKHEITITCERAEALQSFTSSEEDINLKEDISLNIVEDLDSKISEISESYANSDGVVRAFPCVVISDLESSKESCENEETITTSHDYTEDLLESYYSQLARNKEGSESSFCAGTKSDEENLTTEPEISSNYAQTTFSEATNEIFHENLSSSGNSESRHTMEEYRASPFSSSEGISEHSGGSEPSIEFGSSLSCDGTCDQPPRKNIFRVPLSGPTFPHRRHTFQFSSPCDQNKAAFYAQRRSNPDLPPVLLGPPWNLSPTSPMDAKKPPRSPSHRGRDSSSVPREGRSSIQMRRRCRSVSSGSSGEGPSKEGAISSQHRPSSLISISTGQATSSQESLHDFPLRFSPAAGDKAPNIRWLAERKKHEGNECYKNKEYRDALKLYTEAIELCPECAPYYSNRSACFMMLGKYAQALSDAREAVRLDSTFVKGYIRIVKCHVALGDPNAALAVLRQASELEPSNKAIREEEVNAQALMKCVDDADKAASRKDYRMAIFHLDRALALATGCRSHKITKAEYLIFLHRYGDAQEIVNEILQFDSSNADAIYVRGMCLYYQNNHEAAFTHFQHVLRLAPDHKKAKDVYKKAKLLREKKDQGNQAFNRGNFQDALRIYSEALAIDPNNVSTNSKLYCNRATVRAKLCNFEEAVDDVTAAINLDESYVKAYLRRAKCYQELDKHEDAVRDYEKVCKLDRNQENKRLLQEAKALLKRSKWKDYYKILGVTKTASEDEIKKSYKKMALQHHPDRHASASEKTKHEHEVKFKEIGEAYTVLTDNKKKAMYDRGQDVNDPDCGMFSHDDVDPNQIFQAFFGQGGTNAFGFGGGFPGASFSGSNSNNVPGGFHFQFS